MYSTNNYTGAGATTLQNGCSVSDHFLPFQDVSTAVSVNFNGQTFLNNCRLPSLYKIARENRYNGNWLQFQGWANATNIGTVRSRCYVFINIGTCFMSQIWYRYTFI